MFSGAKDCMNFNKTKFILLIIYKFANKKSYHAVIQHDMIFYAIDRLK